MFNNARSMWNTDHIIRMYIRSHEFEDRDLYFIVLTGNLIFEITHEEYVSIVKKVYPEALKCGIKNEYR